MFNADGLKLSEEIATALDSKFWIRYKERLAIVLRSKQSDCENCTDLMMLYRAQGASAVLKRALTTEIKNTLKDLGVSV